MNKVYTIEEVASLLYVPTNVVKRWFDRGLLKGYLHPDTQEPRIPDYHLTRFKKENGLPDE